MCCSGCRLSLGDWNEPCILGEIAWLLVYGIAVDQLGVDRVHRHVGVEEYAKYESLFTLSKQGNNTKPQEGIHTPEHTLMSRFESFKSCIFKTDLLRRVNRVILIHS